MERPPRLGPMLRQLIPLNRVESNPWAERVVSWRRARTRTEARWRRSIGTSGEWALRRSPKLSRATGFRPAPRSACRSGGRARDSAHVHRPFRGRLRLQALGAEDLARTPPARAAPARRALAGVLAPQPRALPDHAGRRALLGPRVRLLPVVPQPGHGGR